MPATFWERHGALMAAAGLALAALAGLAVWKVGRPKPQPAAPPDLQARQALLRWLERPEDGECLGDISQTLRRYVVRAFAPPAGELTTAELCQALAGDERIGPVLAGALAELLRECDRRRFAPTVTAPPFNAASRALKWLDLAQARRTQLVRPMDAPDA
ncbi:MAG: hypothetical protein KGJ60_06865 [Verrucomicrobiota bacterium]|nr:hypothetical protein [Verrucomicrobiota bacterium]